MQCNVENYAGAIGMLLKLYKFYFNQFKRGKKCNTYFIVIHTFKDGLQNIKCKFPQQIRHWPVTYMSVFGAILG